MRCQIIPRLTKPYSIQIIHRHRSPPSAVCTVYPTSVAPQTRSFHSRQLGRLPPHLDLRDGVRVLLEQEVGSHGEHERAKLEHRRRHEARDVGGCGGRRPDVRAAVDVSVLSSRTRIGHILYEMDTHYTEARLARPLQTISFSFSGIKPEIGSLDNTDANGSLLGGSGNGV